MPLFMAGFKKQGEQVTDHGTDHDAKQDGYRNVYEIHDVCRTALSHARKCRKQYNDKNIITGCPGHNELGYTFFGAIIRFHELNHTRDDDGRGNGSEHRSHDCCLDFGNAEQSRCQQNISDDFECGGNKGHQNRRTTDLFQVRKIQRKPGLDQDNDQCHLSQIG